MEGKRVVDVTADWMSGKAGDVCGIENGERLPMYEYEHYLSSSNGDHAFDGEKEEEEEVDVELVATGRGSRSGGTDHNEEGVVKEEAEKTKKEGDVRFKELTLCSLAIVVLTPILATPLILCVDESRSKEARCGYVVLVMAVYWITEVVPLAVTALLPVLLFPVLGIMSAKEASGAYMNDTCMLSMGALTVAVAIEVWDVHKRLALLVVRLVGSEPKRLLLGVSLVTWSLAIFISNTATTAMMLTTAMSLLDMYKHVLGGRSHSNHKGHGNSRQGDDYVTNFSKAMCLTVAYSSSIGGSSSAIGSGPCLIFFATATDMFESRGLRMPITFASWLAFGVPLSFMIVVGQWAWLVVRFLKCRGCQFRCCRHGGDDKEAVRMKALIDREYQRLGPVSYAQKNVLLIFSLMVFSWMTRDFGGVGGWASLFPPKTVSDSTPAVFFALLMFILPSTPILRRGTRKGPIRYRPLLQWQDVHDKMPWSFYLLLGGGIVLAKGCSDTGLSTLFGDQLFMFRGYNKWLILLVLCCLTTLTTEIMSNTATATLLMPVLKQLAVSMDINPIFYMFPSAISAVYAFMLPAATPPNAVVYSKGLLTVPDMASTGVLLNFLAIPLLLFATATWGTALFDLDIVPPEFLTNANTTTTGADSRLVEFMTNTTNTLF